MSEPRTDNNTSNAPFGTEQRRSRTPLIVFGILYGLMFLFILAMAIYQTQR